MKMKLFKKCLLLLNAFILVLAVFIIAISGVALFEGKAQANSQENAHIENPSSFISSACNLVYENIKSGLSDTGIFGSVGVGTDNPERILHVSGNAALFERNANSAGFIIQRTPTLRYVFGVDSPTGFVIKTLPEGQPAVMCMKIDPNGNVSIPGTLSKGSGTFKIDHPLDPANKYLSHSFVESPEMLNIYRGNVVLDSSGEAVVQLPSYFDALNQSYSYKLTCIGAYAPVYIADEISGNRFKIAGGMQGIKVSWQVMGSRQDPFALAHPVIVEKEKAADEKGLYLHPEEYGQPPEKGIGYSQ